MKATRRPIDDTGNTAEAIREWQREQQEIRESEGDSASDISDEEVASTGSTDSSGGTGTGDINDFDLSSYPYKFNPPMHKLSRLVVPNLGEVRPKVGKQLSSFYDDTTNSYGPDFALRKDDKKSKFEDLRLGRIIMDDRGFAPGVVESGTRYGFRFLYNPAEIHGSLQINGNFIPDQRSTATVVLQDGLEQISFEVLINRIPDVTSKATGADYIPQISNAELKRLKEQGTQYDIDYLYRCASGIHDTETRKRTGDIGVLLPNPCRLILGPFTSRGAIVSVSVSNQLFSPDMVPTLSYVNITFARFLSMQPQDIESARSFGVGGRGSGDTDSGGGGGGGGGETGGGGGGGKLALTGREVWELARDAGFSPSDADVMTQIAFKESSWKPRTLNNTPRTGDLSYGLWQINMIGNGGPYRRKLFGLNSNEELFDPQTNARAARTLFVGRRYTFGDWSTYNNGSYSDVKIDWR